MAVTQVQASELFKNLRLLVYYKWVWADEWIYAPYWQPLTANLVAAPGMGSASFLVRYGSGKWEDLLSMTDAAELQAWTYAYIQIRGYEHSLKKEIILWTGIIPVEQIKLLGQSGTTKTAEQILQAKSLDVLLETRIDGGWVKPTTAGSSAVWLDTLPSFNSRYEYGGDVIGNRSQSKESVKKPNWGSSINSYVFSTEGEPWGNYDIAEYLLQNYQEYNGPGFLFRENDATKAALNQLISVYQFRGETTVRQALSALINRSRGFAWTYEVDEEDRVDVVPFSLLDEEMSFGGATIPKNPNLVTLDPWTDKSQVNIEVLQDISPTYDKIIVRGAKLKSCFTVSMDDGTLEKGWTEDEERAYMEAAKNTSGYADLSEAEKAELNDKFRSTDRFERVFTTFRIPKTWDWKIGAYMVNPKRDEDGFLWPDENASYYNVGKRFLNFLPFEVGVDYSGSDADDKNPSNSEPEYRRPFVIAEELTDDKFVYVDRAHPFPAAVRPLAREMGLSVRFNPAYLLARGNWDSDIFEPTRWPSEDVLTYGHNYKKLKATVFLETDQFIQVEANLNDYENKRVLVIDLPDAEVWYVVPDTIIDLDDNGNAIKYNGDSQIIRDDRDRLRAALAAAEAWYGKEHNRIGVIIQGIERGVPIGTLLAGGDVTNIGTSHSVVTSLSWNFQNKIGLTKFSTDFAQLNIAAAFRGSAVASTSGGTVTMPTKRITAKRIEQLERQLKAIKDQLDKNPLRIEPTAGGLADTDVKWVVATEDAPEDFTLQCYWLDANGLPITTPAGAAIVTVYFDIFGPPLTYLSSCLPRIKSGQRIPVKERPVNVSGTLEKRWYSVWWVHKGKTCPC